MFKQLKAIFHFYKGFALITLLVTLTNTYLIYKSGVINSLSIILVTKIAVNGIIWYFYQIFWAKEFYFYHNCHLGQKQLWAGALGIDFLIMIFLFTIVTYLR